MIVESKVRKYHDWSETNSKSPNILDSEVDLTMEPMPIKARPYAHQIIGYNMACRILMITKGGD